ncbi:MAG: exonuclease domain-containing protein [Wujia sp.]
MLGDKRGKLRSEFLSDYVVYDLETTGISPRTDSIIEISAVKVTGGIVTDSFSMLVNPQRPIPAGATAVNGITDAMVENEPVIDVVFPAFLEFIGDFVLVGHNIHCFDMKYLWRVAEHLYGKTITNDYVDTLPLAKKLLPQMAHHRLVDIAEHYQVSTEGAHRAFNDCVMNQLCYEYLKKENGDRVVRNCPHCGGELKLRNGRYGEFWGCMNFPQCRYTENVK